MLRPLLHRRPLVARGRGPPPPSPATETPHHHRRPPHPGHRATNRAPGTTMDGDEPARSTAQNACR